MTIEMSVKTLYIFSVGPVLFVSAVLTLTIDSQLGTSVEDCFERISIGEQLPSDAIYRNISKLTSKECEQICKQDKQCQSYDYGVGAKGNTTCSLSMLNEKEIKDKNIPQRNADYDVYVRRFQCEQSPPTPIQAEFDDPDGLLHRPTFKPSKDSKKPLSDELPDDLGGFYGGSKPDNKPSYNNERPDAYDNSKPDYNLPPSYGVHKPQDIPYSFGKPPNNISSTKPDPNDVLHLQNSYGRPSAHGPWRPEEMYGQRPVNSDYGVNSYQPEIPQYQYIIRPNRKPHYTHETRPDLDDRYSNKPYYPSKPISNTYGPQTTQNLPQSSGNNYPSSSYGKPNGNYNNQHASNHGSQYDNSIYLEINDPPRPYKPQSNQNRPTYGADQGDYEYGHLGYGYDTFSSQNSYSHSQSSQSQHYGSGILTQNGYRPVQQSGHKPPHSNQDSSYGSQSTSNQDNDNGYGLQSTQRPSKPIKKPTYGNGYISGGNFDNYGNSGNIGSGYGGSNYYSNSQSYGNYESSSQNYYSNNHVTSNKPVNYNPLHNFGNSQSSSNKPNGVQGQETSSQNYYGQEQSLYGLNAKLPVSNGGYGSSQSESKPYGGSQEYGSYGIGNKPYENSQGYVSGNQNRPSYSNGYPNDKPYTTNAGYASNSQSNQGVHSESQSNNKPYGESYGSGGMSSSYGPYGSGKPQESFSSISYADRYQSSAGYHSNQVSYGSNIYGSSHSPNNRPYGNSEGYTGQKFGGSNINSNGGSVHTSNKPYGSNHSPDKPHSNNGGYDERPGYGGNENINTGSGNSEGYGGMPQNSGYNDYSNRPSSSQSSYNSQHGSQSSSQSSFESSSSYKRPSDNDGYQKPVNQSSYGPEYNPLRPDVKPVYDYEADRSGDATNYNGQANGNVITSRPVAVGDYGENSGHRRNPHDPSYKACFRRVLAGKRTLRSHVRRVINCERLEDCQRECATERRFHCESFNYRLDPSFRGKGLCELMTKPIEAFDLRRDFVDDKDYDFYELDRNSLEPNCPDTLRGPGLLHSGFLSNKRPQEVDRWKDRIDWYDRTSQTEYERYYNERRRVYNSNRRYQSEAYVPYQIGVSRSDEDQGTGGQYSGSYGGHNYYKDKTDYRKSFNHWQISDEAHRSDYYGIKGHNLNSDFNYNSLGKNSDWENYGYGYGAWKRGKWNSSWNGYDYVVADHFKYNEPSFYYDFKDRIDSPPIKDCSSRRRAGMSLGSGAIRRSLFAQNVVECEAACFGEKEFKCVSYSYKYSSSHGTDNCFLSERPYRGLDMSADSDSDVYAMPQDQGCTTINRKPWVESECFWHVRSDAAVGGVAARASLTVTGLGACEAECIRAHAFFCRGFSFRFDSPTIGDDLENCILTSSPPTSLEIGRGLRVTSGHELYARGNYGRGCEPALYDDVQHKETECYLRYDSAAKLKGFAVRGQARVKDEQECGRVCTAAPFKCLSFSFNTNAGPSSDNCMLSEIRLFDLQREVDYEHSVDDWLFAFDLFNSECWKKVHGKQEYDFPSYEVPHPFPPSVIEYPASGPSGLDHTAPSDAIYPVPSGPSGLGYPSAPEVSLNKPPYTVVSGPEFKPDYPPEYVPDTAPSGLGSSGYKPEYSPTGTGYIKPDNPAPTYKPSNLPHSYQPVIPLPPHKPGYTFSTSSEFDYSSGYASLSSSSHSYKPGYPPIEPSHSYPPLPQKPVYRPGYQDDNGSLMMSWSHYTVSGFPCRRGTTCAQNHVAGHWACEPEGGEIGSWDYCCAPTHRCGYSEGFRKPWCYVGPSHEQWRPCSEKYYPYYKHKVPHPSQGHREPSPTRPTGQWRDKLGNVHTKEEKTPGSYLAHADRKYWDELYKNGPQNYYDKHGNPLPGYIRVQTEERPRVKYQHNPPQPGSGTWVPVSELNGYDFDHIVPEPLGAPRYWPVAYLHKGPPPNMTYFKYNETDNSLHSRAQARKNDDFLDLLPEQLNNESKRGEVIKPKVTEIEGRKIKDQAINNKTDIESNDLKLDTDTTTSTTTATTPITTTTTTTSTNTTPKTVVHEVLNPSEVVTNQTMANTTEGELGKPENILTEEFDGIKGIDGKLEDFSKSLEVFELEEKSKCDKNTDLKTLEAEEKQIEAIGRLVASRRGGKLILEKRSQKDLETKNIAVDKDFLQLNFGNKFPTVGRRGFVQRVSKEDIEKERHANDKSLEVSETTYIRPPPRILSTTENIRRAIVNGKVFYDATLREQRDLFSNITRKSKSLKLEESRGPSVISNSTNSKRRSLQPRNTNPIRRVRRVYRKKFNPEEVRKRLLDREKALKQSTT
ncbi:uncharacterized protein [Battus philenor]|uniref:uncharacterized protein n=1 Tax=Battus philenor TaxID=42288 RepID=UPI0035D10C09